MNKQNNINNKRVQIALNKIKNSSSVNEYSLSSTSIYEIEAENLQKAIRSFDSVDQVDKNVQAEIEQRIAALEAVAQRFDQLDHIEIDRVLDELEALIDN